MEITNKEIQEAINDLDTKYERMQDDAQKLIDTLRYLDGRGDKTSEQYKRSFSKLNRLSNLREENRITRERFSTLLK
tara:strand:+ start:883 stop:1113 length:231 start_codon:yes stop_codon:yes gene_type:complete